MSSANVLAIQCRDLRKSFGGVTALDGVDLALGAGQFLALLGPSGCGKTTTLRLIAGFEEPDGGTIEIGGQSVVGPGLFVPPERRRIGMVFQDYALFPHLDVAGNVGFALDTGSGRTERVQEVLELVGLLGLESRYPHELSGGQQQRVALARALAPRPDLVLLDEPFSNLDAALRSRVRAELREILARAGATTIFVTHEQAEALSLADQVAVMWEGRLLQVGPPEEVYRQPATREVAVFVGDMDSLPGRVVQGRVRCELGELATAAAVNGEVDVFVPPEALRVEPAEDGEAEIVWREFFGHDQRLAIRLRSGRMIHARLDAENGPRPGQRVRLSVRGAVSVFPAIAPNGHTAADAPESQHVPPAATSGRDARASRLPEAQTHGE